MTTDRPTTRTRSRQDDLLGDLLATVPVPPAAQPPAAQPAPEQPAPEQPAREQPAAVPAAPAAVPGTPVVELRLTPLRWALPGALPVIEPAGVRFSYGPLQLFVGQRAG